MSHVLLMVGAHNGAKQEALIRKCAKLGKVILMEPVPFLFESLAARYKDEANITCLNKAIDVKTGKKSFYMLDSKANSIAPWGDQLGSFNLEHAPSHDTKFKEAVQEIEVETISFNDLIEQQSISKLHILFTDTEGYDALLLQSFPFDKIKPDQIQFEYKHSDGVFRVGKNFANILLTLDQHGYHMRINDLENCYAHMPKQNTPKQ